MGFCSFETASRTLQGYKMMNMLRKGDVRGQIAQIATLFGAAV